MGAPMARNLLAAGLPVRVWNRTASKAAPLVNEGAVQAETPAQAAKGADIVITMLADGPTLHDVMAGTDGALATLGRNAVWAQMSTVGVQHTQWLVELAEIDRINFVDAPVLGTKQPAEQGTLLVLESGDPANCAACAPAFQAVGGRTMHVSDQPGASSRLKLVANNWVLAITGATAETVALSQALGVHPQMFLDAISGGALDVPYAHIKGAAMISERFDTSFPLSLAAKDARLVLEAAGETVNLDGTRAVLDHLESAMLRGHGDEDMAALYYGVRP
jgi:3-hydroxyisobutyrate dehydrogenase